MLKAFRQYRAARLEEQESLFGSGFATPRSERGDGMEESGEYVKWSEVEAFLQMAEQALKARVAANENLHRELEQLSVERRKVEKTSSAAQEESSFLAEHMQSLLDERTALKEALEKAQREKEHMTVENELLRQELLEGSALGEESSAAMQLVTRQQEELRAAEQRTMQLENDNVQLQARVSALERANAAQLTALLSCLEESERVRLQSCLQQESTRERLQRLSISVPSPSSPQGTLSGLAQLQRSEFTDDSSAGRSGFAEAEAEAAEAAGLGLGSEASGSYVSCGTPLGSATSSGGAAGSIFRSADSSPSGGHQGREQQQVQVQRQAGRSCGGHPMRPPLYGRML